MRTIAHISDLHFGAEEPAVVSGLLADLAALRPDLVVVTGDFTQRARQAQFAAARKFLDAIAAPRLVVPGNHDIPLYNVAARFGWPLAGYRKYISSDLRPTYADAELAVAGINTARSNTWKDGRASVDDIAWLRSYFCSQPDSSFKILAAHHPFIPPVRDPSAALVGRAREALAVLAACGCHVILAGHLHHAYAGDTRPHHVEIERSILVVQAGTAVSHRRRDEANAYNMLTVDGARLRLEVRRWTGAEFAAQGRQDFRFEGNRWLESAVTVATPPAADPRAVRSATLPSES